MNIDIIIECERCHGKKFISVKNIGNLNIREIITRHSKHRYMSIFSVWRIVCPKCQEAYVNIVKKQAQESNDFIEGGNIKWEQS